ncbi:hypothetical protein E2C00_00290 [Streptomyces sp. WAC05374]|uniref:DUF6233 domain-containing protein n=1 Tax=Streptomyces sp. WAC05374 TaxID=2487420 RepID=UPI000F8982EE|nr:DUF6233 domain-containing protein [Streptomyces sp. WAC05374]RST19634.1 hypothetical protein EF905_00655 [Streptomyces sp. WAC05374]TDF50029.1 hypothetical protein E2B92_00265 [Streptomyces sp. WAC05374]TDF57755.1 hypothetical protein E2C02_08055 [Streptomyces sp. WAC05374]TDF60283.1 hypothetical protein E2C00_00290 [Streptomyces sp. WAC05374]
MSDPLPPPYPPDNERLADIETYLTVHLTYVRQVRAAEARRCQIQQRTAPPPPPPYRLQRGLDAARAVVRVHLGDSAMAKKAPGVDDLTARRALVEGVEACAVCRPDTELGLIDGWRTSPPLRLRSSGRTAGR